MTALSETEVAIGLVRSFRWRNVPGMLFRDGGLQIRCTEKVGPGWGQWRLDLRDPGTAGGLLALLAEAGLRHQDWHLSPSERGFTVWVSCLQNGPVEVGGYVDGSTVGEAVGRALLAVWAAE